RLPPFPKVFLSAPKCWHGFCFITISILCYFEDPAGGPPASSCSADPQQRLRGAGQRAFYPGVVREAPASRHRTLTDRAQHETDIAARATIWIECIDHRSTATRARYLLPWRQRLTVKTHVELATQCHAIRNVVAPDIRHMV